MSKLTDLTIDRKRWGTGDKGGALLNEDNNKMCCLGFACKSLGFTNRDIIEVSFPHELGYFRNNELDETKKIAKLFPLVNKRGQKTKIIQQLADTNDSTSVYYDKNPKKRENRIKTLFSKLGVKVKFIN